MAAVEDRRGKGKRKWFERKSKGIKRRRDSLVYPTIIDFRYYERTRFDVMGKGTQKLNFETIIGIGTNVIA